MSDEQYFPGLSEKTQNLNNILESLYNFQLREFNDSNLNQISEEIRHAELDLFELDSYTNPRIDEIRTNLAEYSLQLDLHLSNLVDDRSSKLERILSSMKSSQNNLSVLNSLRKEANSIDDYISDINESINSREIDIPEIFTDYSNKREQIKGVNQEISLLNERYHSFFNSDNPKKELKSLLKATKTKDIFKTKLYKKCKESGYYEGIILLSQMHNNINILLYNKTEYNSFITYNKNQSTLKRRTKQKPKKTRTISETKTEFSHLHALISSIGFPEDYSYLRLRDTLNGKYSSNWSNRLNQFSLELEKIELTDSGRDYLSQIGQCLDIAIEQGQYLDEIKFARTSIKRKLTA
jgi:hypothetical protein